MATVAGTQGYEAVVEPFTRASLELDFEQLNKHLLPFLPATPARVLDLGSGVGQNAAALAQLGYEVVAVEPLKPFLDIAKAAHSQHDIVWVEDSMPRIDRITPEFGAFDFVLIDAVWHHLDHDERQVCIERLAALTRAGGICAISLRNGPAGAGTHAFPTSVEEIASQARHHAFQIMFSIEDQPSIMPNKPRVTWARVVLEKLPEEGAASR